MSTYVDQPNDKKKPKSNVGNLRNFMAPFFTYDIF